MKTSMTLKIKSKKLKELTTERAKLVGGGSTPIGTEPQQVQGVSLSALYSILC
ncbi:hypothetical protein [Pseudoalteromonas sp. S16_S37]|uniref:hypothetical protein n=1 Tax=Pseudoalteromonas sp. S16_S37 TaxID=2720228 RepID=UPI001680F7B2|nr:hypothetical protein [Pseudoalteromonas sp. S16_S37]MBD1580770.1 hypothetical protein [Pseudoalteromonas sp. S16_S37]